jgi:hypothetical protein
MPLIDRRAAQLAKLNGFVVQNGSGSNFAMAGGRGINAMCTIDGGNAQTILLGVATLSYDPPVESLEEFNVEISNDKAELGRTGASASFRRRQLPFSGTDRALFSNAACSFVFVGRLCCSLHIVNALRSVLSQPQMGSALMMIGPDDSRWYRRLRSPNTIT